MLKKFDKFVLRRNVSIKQAIKKIDEVGYGMAIFLDKNNRLIGILTDGDIRKAILRGIQLDEPMSTILNKNPIVAYEGQSDEEIIHTLREIKRTFMPVVNQKKQLIGIEFLEDLGEEVYPKKTNPVVIMAGGKGTRLNPFTQVLPKALIPLKNEPVIETIMKKFCRFGFEKFLISVNYRKDFIKMYFNDKSNFNISFIEEETFLGTLGSLSLMRNDLTEDFFVINCDTLVNSNYEDIIEYHQKNNNLITLVVCMRENKIPYGIIKLDENNEIDDLIEKPTFHNMVNVGLYVFSPAVLKYIPDNKKYSIIDLIKTLKENKEKVGVFPVTEKNWFDVGQWEEYKQTIDLFKELVKY